MRGAVVDLWGGPEDGGDVYLPPGDLPATVAVHRTRRGELVGIRGRGLGETLAHLPVYEQCSRDQVPGTTGRAVYVYRPVVQRWRDQV